MARILGAPYTPDSSGISSLTNMIDFSIGRQLGALFSTFNMDLKKGRMD